MGSRPQGAAETEVSTASVKGTNGLKEIRIHTESLCVDFPLISQLAVKLNDFPKWTFVYLSTEPKRARLPAKVWWLPTKRP